MSILIKETDQEHLQRELMEHEQLAEGLLDALVFKPDSYPRMAREAEQFMLRKTLAQLAYIESKHGKVKDIVFVGGGTGMEAETFARAGYEVAISDLSPNMVRCAQKRFESRGLTAKKYFARDSQALPLEDGSYCVGVAYEALHHAPHPEIALRELARVSKKGIILVEPFTSPIYDALSRFGLAHRVEYSGLKPYRYTSRELNANLRGLGFESWRIKKYLRLPEDYLPKRLHESPVFTRIYKGLMRAANILPVLGNQGIVVARKPS